ncbi:NUDIX domain-containing protein [Streptomyces sp. KR80]|uniref:NUDIX domain-containing protein n=1 Tax=Streptomyces sp. KR80 TaxID=3457426 RepID=UPI003FD5EA3B
MTDAAEPLVTDHRGLALYDFRRAAEGGRFDGVALLFSVVALWQGDQLLMVHERGRQCWELPGGGIEPGETPREAAVRELREESGQTADGLRFIGCGRFALGAERRIAYGALYAGETSTPREFTPNPEITAIAWWDRADPLPGRTQPVDVYLAGLTHSGADGFGRAV